MAPRCDLARAATRVFRVQHAWTCVPSLFSLLPDTVPLLLYSCLYVSLSIATGCLLLHDPGSRQGMSLKHIACCTCNVRLVPLQAEQDCTEALAADATFIKAWHRRGTARRAQGKLLEAAEDFEAALRLEPGSVALAKDRWGVVRPISL